MIKEAALMSNFTDVYLYQFAYKGNLGMQMDVPYIAGEIKTYFYLIL